MEGEHYGVIKPGTAKAQHLPRLSTVNRCNLDIRRDRNAGDAVSQFGSRS